MFADAFLAADGRPSVEQQAQIEAELTEAELVELGIGLALFHGFSKLIIAFGCEPDQMDITELRTPGS